MSRENTCEFEYLMNCLDSLTQKHYREALKVLGDGLRSQLKSSGEVDGRTLLKDMNTLVSYLEYRLEEDFGFSVDDEDIEDQMGGTRRCGFCGAEETQRQLIAGPTALICADCIEGCAALINSR